MHGNRETECTVCSEAKLQMTGDGRLGMYGPPLRRKRNGGCHELLSANGCGLCWSESLLAGWSAPRFFPISDSISRDLFRVRVSRAPDSIVVPSPYWPADLARSQNLRSNR
jgi:hypothetical protein